MNDNPTESAEPNWFVAATQWLIIRALVLLSHLTHAAAHAYVPWCWLVNPLVYLVWLVVLPLAWISGMSMKEIANAGDES